MTMKNTYALLLSLLVVGLAVPAFAQTSDNVVINEVDVNPPGNDVASVSEWVELYNPTNSTIDLGGWQVASTTALKKTMTIPDETIIESGEFLTYSYQSAWFTDSNESVELRDKDGTIVDKTHLISDVQNNFYSWQRIYDGFDLDSADDWKFVKSTAGSSNGKLIKTQESKGVTITLDSEKSSYLFGETAVLYGSVSEKVFVEKPFFKVESITLTISGPNYHDALTLYPDLNLDYKTTLNLHQTLGIDKGLYRVSASYAGSTATASFNVGFEMVETEGSEDSELGILTDKSQYIPGESVTITGFTTSVIPFEGMSFTVTDGSGDLISHGTLFPVDGKFKTSLFITTVNPNFGEYTVHAKYHDKSISNTFKVVEDVKEDAPVSLWTDRPVYALGDTVQITGRLNDVWIGTLDLEITQTKQTSISTSSDSGFKILDGLQVAGDGSFSYSFAIPDNPLRHGDYKITVSKDIGSATIVVSAVEDPDTFVTSDDPLTVYTDSILYDLGDQLTVSGFVKDPFGNSSYSTGTPVKITITHEDEASLKIVGSPTSKQSSHSGGGASVGYDLTAIPETSGSYSAFVDITRGIFTEGNYVIKSHYQDHTATASFTVEDSLNLEDGALIFTDKQVYGLGEHVALTGILPPTGDHSVEITLIRPDGTRTNSGASVDNQRFTWSWTTPTTEKYQNIKSDEGREGNTSNFGVYRILVSTDSSSKNIFFKVSEDPANDSLPQEPIVVGTEKSLYKVGEKLRVTGNVMIIEQGDEGIVVPYRVTIQILDGTFPYRQIHQSKVYPEQGGAFTSLFELPATVFPEGQYTVRASYQSSSAQSAFNVANDFLFGSDAELELLLSTDKSEYHPGDTVIVTGKPTKLVYLEKFDISFIQQSENSITCGSFYCGEHVGPITSVLPSPSGSFAHELMIPDLPSSVGPYEVTVDADFDSKSIRFDVVERPAPPKLGTVIEKQNRISESAVSIFTEEKTVNSNLVAPRVVSGSLITPDRNDSDDVNLKVSTATGVCIIGPDADCLVRESTRESGQIYDVVEVDGLDLNVRYSGPDVRLEKFSISPESPVESLPDTNWNVQVIKEDQVSRLYYKVTYKPL